MNDFALVSEIQSEIGLVAVPQAQKLPSLVFVGAFLHAQKLQMFSGRTGRKVELDARIDSGYQELVFRKLRHQRAAMMVLGSRWLSFPAVLRKSERHSSLPVAEVEFFLVLAFFFNRGLHFTLKIKARNLAAHGSDQGKIFGVENRSFVRFIGPSRTVHPERGETDRALSQGVEEIIDVDIVAASFRIILQRGTEEPFAAS